MNVPNEGIIADKYIVIELIGVGLTSNVYKIEEKETQKIYAAKIFHNKYKHFFFNEEEILNILKEKKIPDIINIEKSGFGEISIDEKKEEKHYIIMEYASKLNLFFYTNKLLKGFEEKHAKYLFYKIVKAVQSIHGSNICHLDLKTSNILLYNEFSPKICDFGFAKYVNKKMKYYCGTTHYQCPEIMMKKPYDGTQADIFSLGVILFELVFGDFGFEIPLSSDKNYKLIKNNNSNEFWHNYPESKNISDDFKKLYFKIVSFDPKNRPTIEEILNNNWLKEIKDLEEKDIKNLELEIIQVIKDKILKIEKILKPKLELDEYNKNKGKNKEGEKDEKEYFTCDTIITSIEKEKCRKNYTQYIELVGDFDPVEFMNDFANRIKKAKNNWKIEISQQHNLAFKICIEEEEKDFEEEEQEENSEENNEGEENDDDDNDNENNNNNIINSNDVIIKTELMKIDEEIFYLVFSNCSGEFQAFYNNIIDIYNLLLNQKYF